jgi:succinate dehydrogenase flavin-adding protein (antitoxin of CptAB toxin-antitoxin module)
MKFKKLLVFCVGILLSLQLFADEGMFALYEIENLNQNKLKQMGLELSLKDLRDVTSKAVVSLGGGTGSFVSNKGLIITNHHVAYRAIQINSNEKHDYIENGFLAKTLKEELPARGYYADIILSMEDVTSKINSVVNNKMTDEERSKAIENIIKKIETETEKSNPGIRASISGMYGGSTFILFKKIRLTDIRLVYAPPASIGEFGGDIDNFEWPRHTGDFSFLRAYVGKDGKPASYSKDNIPYTPKEFLKISIKPLKEGDFSFIIGFPGSTNRYMTAEQIKYSVDQKIPLRIGLFKDVLSVLDEIGKTSKENHIRVAGISKGLNNSLKYYQGVQNGLKRDRVKEIFAKRDIQIAKWIENNKEMEKYKNTITDINKINKEVEKIDTQATILGYASYLTSLVSAGGTISRWAEEKTKPDLERDPQFMNRNINRIKSRLANLQINLLIEKDKKLLKYFLNKLAQLPTEKRGTTFNKYFKGPDFKKEIDEFVDTAYAKTKLGDKKTRLKYFEMSKEELAKANDPLLTFSGEIAFEIKNLRENTRALSGAMLRLKPQVIKLLHTYLNNELYPDANSTIRLTYGKITGYCPDESTTYFPFTTLKGVIAKERGEEPFNNPEKLIELYKSGAYKQYGDSYLKGQLAVNFLTDNDTTGGNSGSPTMNGKGELIGLLFDGNFESISADYYFNPALTRSIVVDSRYIIFILDKFSNAQNLLNEITLVK